ncbi:hypothetical protein [Clostridium sp.]|mgnify:CR=1 FL=1|uniref:hypothetical protein n=1 Tax=Clostridium sp. TaxID=1506 RepID=UPI0026081538|nr:hypothetical protein [uncultured Clostridium sp.]
MIIITERDRDFLMRVNETGACNTRMLFECYPRRYAKDRIEKMGIEKIVNRKYGLIMIGVEGKNYLESIEVVPKIVATLSTVAQRKLARVLELKYLLPNMKIGTSANYKKENKLNRGMLFIAVATTNNNINYLVYDIPKTITAETKIQILKELKNKKNVITNALIFTRNKDFVQILSTNNVYISELLVMPPSTVCMKILNAMGEGDFDRKVIGAAFPELLENKVFNKKQNKYMVGANTYINLVLNNVSAINMLSSLDILAIQNNNLSNQVYILVCLDNQHIFLSSTIEKLNFKKLIIEYKTIAPGQTSFY